MLRTLTLPRPAVLVLLLVLLPILLTFNVPAVVTGWTVGTLVDACHIVGDSVAYLTFLGTGGK